MTTVGIISDTHGLLRPQAIEILQGSDLIVHAGDIGSPDVVERLADIAPVVAIRGNIDTAEWAEKFPLTRMVTLEDKHLCVLHNIKELDCDPAAESIDVVVFGHSHKPGIECKAGVLYVNPGSAGPRRFKLPIAVAKLQITSAGIEGCIHELVV